jgi:hypothetical protein
MFSASTSKLDVAEDVDVADNSGVSRIDVTTPTAGTIGSGRTTTTYRYSRKKAPILQLEKLNAGTDSNGMRNCAYYLLMDATVLHFIYLLC